MGNTSPDNIVYPDATGQVGNVQADMVTMANSVQAAITDLRADVNSELNDFYNMPTPVTRTGASVQGVTATSWANLPNISNISFNFSRPCWVQVTLGAWVVATVGEIRAGINVSGATTQPPNQPGWGNTIYQSFDNANTVSQQVTKLILCNAGTTTFTAQAYQAGGGTKQLNYSVLMAAPLYYNTAMPGGV